MCNRLCQLRMEKNITQKELAKEINVRIPTVSDWENGKKKPSLDLAHKIAVFFELNIEEIFFVTNKSPNKIDTENKKNRSRYFENIAYKKKEIQREISLLTFDSEWRNSPETVRIVRSKIEELDKLVLKNRDNKKKKKSNRQKIAVIFSDHTIREYDSLTDACKNEHISIHTIRRHLKDGEPDKFGRMYERVNN